VKFNWEIRVNKAARGQTLFPGIPPSRVKDPSTRAAYEIAIEENDINIQHGNLDGDLQEIERKVLEATGGYSGVAFDLFDENEEKNAIIVENVADLTIRKKLEELLDWVRSVQK